MGQLGIIQCDLPSCTTQIPNIQVTEDFEKYHIRKIFKLYGRINFSVFLKKKI